MISNNKDKIDFAIITALPKELHAVLPKLGEYQRHFKKPLHTYRADLQDISVIVTCSGERGVKAASIATTLLERYEPSYLLLIGIAAGFESAQVQIGDVVVAEACYYDGPGKETPIGKWSADEQVPTSTELYTFSQHYHQVDWKDQISVAPPTHNFQPSVHYGLIASSETVVASKQKMDSLLKIHRKLRALAQEGYAVAKVAHDREVKFLEIRGICDFGDENKNDIWHDYASDVVTAYAVGLLRCIRGICTNPTVLPTQSELPLISNMMSNLPREKESNHYELEMVGGAIPLNSNFYIKREVDEEFQQAIARRDSIVLLKGARQVGKTSLLARGLQQARDMGVQVLSTDFQWLDNTQLLSLENFFIAVGELLAEQLDLDISPRDKWSVGRSPKMNFDRFFRRELLSKTNKPVLWAIDEADRLFLYPFSSDIFSLFRVWHNERATQKDTPCARLTLAIAYATETNFFIEDPAQSPFNVGTKLILEDFSFKQLQELHQRYSSPLNETELKKFFDLTHGQPYLSRRGLNDIVARQLLWDEFLNIAFRDDGPFGDHLRRLTILLNKETLLATEVCRVIAGNGCSNDDSFYRLRSLGVLIGEFRTQARLRCELYTNYLKDHLVTA